MVIGLAESCPVQCGGAIYAKGARQTFCANVKICPKQKYALCCFKLSYPHLFSPAIGREGMLSIRCSDAVRFTHIIGPALTERGSACHPDHIPILFLPYSNTSLICRGRKRARIPYGTSHREAVLFGVLLHGRRCPTRCRLFPICITIHKL